MTAEQERVIRGIATDLYELARVKRESDSHWVEIRRSYLTSLAEELMHILPRIPHP